MPITAEGVRTDGNPVPLWERETLTLPQAAQVFKVDTATVDARVERVGHFLNVISF